MTIRIPVHPQTYFVDHVSNNQIRRNIDRTTVYLPAFMSGWVDMARFSLPRDRSREAIVSHALAFGADRPIIEWDMPVTRFDDIKRESIRRQSNGESEPSQNLSRWSADHEPDTLNEQFHFRMENHTEDIVRRYRDLLGANQSVIVRHCIALAFHYYDADVVNGDSASRWREDTKRYVTRFKSQMEWRIDLARDEFDMDI